MHIECKDRQSWGGGGGGGVDRGVGAFCTGCKKRSETKVIRGGKGEMQINVRTKGERRMKEWIHIQFYFHLPNRLSHCFYVNSGSNNLKGGSS